MSGQKAMFKWINSVVAFILLVVLSITGFVNWLALPRGFETSRGGLVTLRHFIREIHEVTALLFLAAVFLHLATHWSYIKAGLKRYGLMR